MFGRGVKGVSDATGTTQKIKNKVKGLKDKVKNATTSGNKGKGKNQKGCGDPIDVVTGSLMMDYEDLTLHDTGEDFVLHRIHESVITNKGMMLGSRWFLNIETRLRRDGGTVTVQREDMHLETFRLEDGTWKNARNGDCSVTLQECREGYLFEERTQQKKYVYDADGRITGIEDAWGCRTCFTYEGGVLAEMRFASGQFLKFTFDNGKLAMMEDTIGRQLRYEYEDDLLTAVTMPNGGRIRYTYTNAKNKKYVTMKNRTIVCEND